MNNLYSIEVECNGPRPEARAIAGIAWKDATEVTLAGDFENPTNQSWSRLSVSRADNPQDRIDIEPMSQDPLVLKISSNEKKCAYKVGFFIAIESGGRCL